MTHNLIFFVIWYSILLSVGQLFLRIKIIEKITRSILFLSLAVIFQQSSFILLNNANSYHLIYTFQFTLFFLLGPLLYYTYHWILFKDHQISKKTLLNLIPTIFAVFADIWFFFFDVSIKFNFFNNPITLNNSFYTILYKLILLGAAIQMCFYFGKLFLRIFRMWNIKDLNSIIAITAIYILLTMISFFIVINSYLINSVLLLKIGSILSAILLLSTYFVSQRYPKFMKLLVKEVKTKSYEKSLLTAIDTNQIIEKLEKIMINEKYYADEDLTIKQLAQEVNITAHQLSQLLNERLNVNFNTFVNKFRIEEAKEMLLEEQKRSVLSIAYAVGFNSKSSFYDAFSKFTQQTPHKFRKDKLENKKK